MLPSQITPLPGPESPASWPDEEWRWKGSRSGGGWTRSLPGPTTAQIWNGTIVSLGFTNAPTFHQRLGMTDGLVHLSPEIPCNPFKGKHSWPLLFFHLSC